MGNALSLRHSKVKINRKSSRKRLKIYFKQNFRASGVLPGSSNLDAMNGRSIEGPDNLTYNSVKYGKLVILGDSPRNQSKLSLKQRRIGNGFHAEPFQHHAANYHFHNDWRYSFTYLPDPAVDMFQIGRGRNSCIDFAVEEGGNQNGNRKNTVAKYAGRIQIQRQPPYLARIYAAGFDDKNIIFLDDDAVIWNFSGNIIAFPGISVMIFRCGNTSASSSRHAGDNSKDVASSSRQYLPAWREVSVCGDIYIDRQSSEDLPYKVDEDNTLADKTLIDFGGILILYRSVKNLHETLRKRDLQEVIDDFNKANIQCPINFGKLRLPFSSTESIATDSNPYVYLKCGHVYGRHTWRDAHDRYGQERTCPQCRQRSHFIPLKIGHKSSFHFDKGFLNHCFDPCGHLASETTARFWCSIPPLANSQRRHYPVCPFCLVIIKPAPVCLRFDTDSDDEVPFG